MKKYWFTFLAIAMQTLTFATNSGIITESIEYPPDQSEVKICLEGTYEKIEIPYLTRYPNGIEISKVKPVVVLKPFEKPIVGSSSISIGNKVISQNQKTIPFFLIGQFPCYDEYASLLGKQVYVEGVLQQSNDLFFFHTPQIHLDYILDVKWKNARCEILPYEPEDVLLEGNIYQVTYPGPPEYMSVENGDIPETSWILVLNRPIHVGKANQSIEDDINYPEKYVLEVAVIPPEGVTNSVMNKKVRVKGSLFHSHTAHHSRRILCEAKSIDIIQEPVSTSDNKL